MNSFAIYRLPYATTCTRIEQHGDRPQQLQSCTQLDGQQGFVLAPFQATPAQPILLIRADRVEQLPIESAIPTPPCVATTDDHRSDYAADFACFHSQLAAGTFSKLVLARSVTLCCTVTPDPMTLFWQACQCYPRLFIALAALPDGTCWLTATPEILLENTGHEWRTVALAGTMSLSGNELLGEGENARWSTKNIQEQRYVATYIAENLKQQGISYSEEGPRTVRAANLVHLRSDFTFGLPSHCKAGQLLQALHPTPAVCGLPKQAALDFILRHEHCQRQYYSGFMGPLGVGGQTHLYVSLRCMQLAHDRLTLYAGGGLLRDSVEEQEWQETEDKLETMRRLLRPHK